MNEILAFISAEIGAIIVLTIVAIIIKWLFIRSAIKSGVEGAINSSWFQQIIRTEAKEAMIDTLYETGIINDIEMKNLIEDLK